MKTFINVKSLFLSVLLMAICFMAGAQVGAGPIPTLPKGKSIKIVYDATINTGLPAGTTTISHQGTVSGSNFSSASTNTVVTPLDVPPFVVSITRKTPTTATAINNTNVTYLVTFSEAVSSVDVGDFTLTKTSTADATIASVSAGPATTFDVTLNPVSGDGTIRLDLNASGTGIVDDGGTAITGGFTAGEVYTFDHTAPTLSPVTITSNNITNTAFAKVGDKVSVNFTSSETIATPTATIHGQTATITNVSGNQYKAEYTLQSSDAPEGLITFSISFTDGAGNAGTAVTAVTTDGGSVTFDKTAPAVSSFVRHDPASETTSATAVTFRITFSEAVSGVDNNDFTLTGAVAGTIGIVTAVSGSNNTQYDVAVNGLSGTGTLGITLKSSGTGIIDVAGNQSGGYTTGETYTRVNAPTVTSITRYNPSGQLTNANIVTYQVVFSIGVTNVDASDFSLTTTGTVSSTVGTVNGSGTTYQVQVSGIGGNGTLRLDLKSSGTGIQDANNTAINGGYTSGETYTFDHVAPILTYVAIASNNSNPAYAKEGNTVTLTFTADEAIGSPAVTIAGQNATSITNPSVNTWIASYVMASGDAEGVVAFTINFSDGAGNAGMQVNSTTNSSSVTFDRTAPTVLSVNRHNPAAELTNGSTVTFRMTFSEAIRNVDASDLAVVATGSVAGYSIGTISSSSGTTIDVTLNGITGVGTLKLNVNSGASVNDVANNALASGFTTGEQYTIDRTAPTVQSINRKTPSTELTNASEVVYTITFSEVVSGVSTDDFTVVLPVSGLSGSISAISASSGTSMDVTVSTLTGEGVLGLNLNSSGTGITDGAGNAINGGFTGQTYTVDRVAPKVFMISRFAPSDMYTNATTVTFGVQFEEDVTGVDETDFFLSASGVSGTITSLTGSGNQYYVTVSNISGDGTMKLYPKTSGTGIQDAAGNSLTEEARFQMTYFFDHTPPSVQNIVRQNPTNAATTSTTLVYRVDFNEVVSGVDIGDFTLSTGVPAVSGTIASVAVVPGSENRQYDVTVNNVTVNGGTLRLDLKSSGTGIIDHVTNPISGGFTTGETYTLGIPPSITGCPATPVSHNAVHGQCYATITKEALLNGLFINGAPTPAVTVWIGSIAGTEVTSSYNFPVGNTTVVVKASNGIGQDATCSFIVNMTDNQNPTITAPAAITAQPADAGSCGAAKANVNLGSPTTGDNCGVQETTNDAPAVFPLGTTTVTWTVTDVNGRTNTATQNVTVVDNQKPTITNITVTPVVLWPPNHKMRDVTINYTVADNCSSSITKTLSVKSNEPINGTGDGDTDPDWIIDPANPHHVQLRAERANKGNGRIYTITITATDATGNSTVDSVKVYVSHNISDPITGSSYKIGSTVNFKGAFWDVPGNRHTAQWLLDGNTTVRATVVEPAGSKNGSVSGAYKFGSAGIYKLQMNITDQNKLTTTCNTNDDLDAMVVIYDPNGGYGHGGGWYHSPKGSLRGNTEASGKVSYGFNVNYFKKASNPKGETQFEFKQGGLEFNALNYEYLSVSGYKAQVKGSGRIIGDQSGYAFILTVIDGEKNGGGGVDKIRMKIFNKNTGEVIYDNQPGASDAADPITAVGANSTITITGGNISTGSTSSKTMATISVDDGTDELPADDGLQVQALPNPTRSHFTLVLRSRINERVNLRVVDGLGRTVEARNGIGANSSLTFGATFRPGIYFVEAVQGKQRVTLKLIKQSD